MAYNHSPSCVQNSANKRLDFPIILAQFQPIELLELSPYILIDRYTNGHLNKQFFWRIPRLKCRADANARAGVVAVSPGNPGVVHFRLARHVSEIDRRGDQFRLIGARLGQKFVDPIESLPSLTGHRVAFIGGGYDNMDQAIMLHGPRPAGIALWSPLDRHCTRPFQLSKRSIRKGSIGRLELPWVTRSAITLPTIGPSWKP